MTEATGKNVVSLLEEHVDLAISTVKKLRNEKLELEAEVARLNSDVLQRDAKIQELESLNSDLRETSELARLATEEERAGIRKQLEGLMAGLNEPDGTSGDTDETSEKSETEVMFKANS
jgi:predicted  nucleic acid-binding Zn-ribbon protein